MTVGESAGAAGRAVEAVWRVESGRLVAGLARVTGDFGLAEEAAQDALLAALEDWTRTGIPANPAGWLMTTAKRKAVDRHRRANTHARKVQLLGRDVEVLESTDGSAAVDDAVDDQIGDDLLRLVFTACHPALSMDARVALTLRCLGGLNTAEVARAFLVPEATVAQRIVRAKRRLEAERVTFELPTGTDMRERLASVLEVIFLIFNEGYAAAAGDAWIRPELCGEAMRLGRLVAALEPGEPEVHGLIALMDLQASRIPARVDAPVLRCSGAPGRPGPAAVGPLAHPTRYGGTGGCRLSRGPRRRVHGSSGDRCVSRSGAHRRGDRLGGDRRPLLSPAGGVAQPGGGPQPGRRRRHGGRARSGPRDRRRSRRVGRSARLPDGASRAS